MLKQSLNAFELIQLRFNKFQYGFKGVENIFEIVLQQNRMADVEANVEAVSFLTSLRWPIYIINSVDKTKLSSIFVKPTKARKFGNKIPFPKIKLSAN